MQGKRPEVEAADGIALMVLLDNSSLSSVVPRLGLLCVRAASMTTGLSEGSAPQDDIRRYPRVSMVKVSAVKAGGPVSILEKSRPLLYSASLALT